MMDERNRNAMDAGSGGPANTPPFGETPATRTAADHQIPEETGSGMGAPGRGSTSETERELERTRDLVAETAAPVMAEKTQEALQQAADRVAHDPRVREQVKRTASAAQHDAQRMAREKMGEMAERAEHRIDQGMQRAAGGIESAAQRLDDLADERLAGGGMMERAGDLAHGAADALESLARYLRENDPEALRTDLERQVRERPMQTLLIGLAAGWMVGKILR